MKTIIRIVLVLILSSPVAVEAQQNIGGLKKKVKVKKDDDKKDNSESPLQKTSPAENEIKSFASEFKYAKEDVEQKDPQLKFGIQKLEKLLVTIKEKDPAYSEMGNLESQLKDVKDGYTFFMEEKRWKDHFFQNQGYARKMGEVHTTYEMITKRADSLNFEQYQKDRAYYIEKFNDPDLKSLIKLDAFYSTTFEKEYLPLYIQGVKKDIAEADRLYKTMAPYEIARLEKTIPIVEGCAGISPKNQSIMDLRKEVYAKQDQIQSYIDSGEYEKYLATLAQEKIDKVRLEKPEMNDVSVNQIVSLGMDQASYGKPIRYVITNASWQVKKNGLGIPLNKYLFVQVATKKDGKCYKHYGWVRKDYNGGSYGKMYWDGSKYLEEMNCDNVNK